MNFRTRPHFEDRQIVQYLDESITLSGITNIAPIVLNFSGTTTAETAVTISELTGYLNGGKLSGFVVKPPTLLQSGTTATTTTNVENFVLKSLDQYGSVGWAPISGISWSVSACTSPFITTDIQPCTLGGTITINAGDLEINNTVRINDGSQVNGYVFTSDVSGNGSWLPPVDNYTTGATLNGTIIEFNRTDLSNAYNVDIKPALLDYLPLRITGNTVVSVDDNVDLYFSGFTGSSIINYVNYGDSLEYINGTVISKDYATLFNRRVTNLETFSIYAIQSKGIALDYSDSGGTVNEFYVNKSAMLANSTIPTFQGIKYGSDYSPNYTNRSLVDKEYVDNLVSSTIFTGNTSASCITDLWVSNIHGCSPITIWDSVQSIGSLATGTTSFALGIGNLANGIASFAEGGNTTANGPASHAEGSGTLADGDASHAEGYQTIALGDYSHVEGWQTLASGNFGSHAEGFLTIASGTTSHSEGRSTVAGGSNSHAEGNSTKAYGNDSHSEGSNTIANGTGSHAEGGTTIAIGNYSHAEGEETISIGLRSHTEGYITSATTTNAHAEGFQTLASGGSSHAEGSGTVASGDNSHAEGDSTIASGTTSHAEGGFTTAIGQYSHAEGYVSSAVGDYSHAEGLQTLASGNSSHAEGYDTVSIGDYSHAEGELSTTYGSHSHAEGTSITYGSFSHSQNYNTRTYGTNSHAGGDNSIASGNTSFIHSTNSLVTGNRSVVLGGQNITGTTDDTVYIPYLNISNLAVGSPVNNLGIDSNGNVVVGTSGSGSTGNVTIDPYFNVGSASTLTWDVSGTSTNYEITLTANTTLNLTNVRNGDYGSLILNQDSVGSRSMTLGTVNGSSITHLVVNGGGGLVSLTTNPNAVDLLSFTYNGSKMFWTVGNDYT